MCQRFLEAVALHLTIADLAEQPGEPFEFVVDVAGGVPVQQLAEHPQSAARPADRHPGVVDRVTAPAQAEVAVEDGVDLFGDVTHERPTRCGANGGSPRAGWYTRASLDG